MTITGHSEPASDNGISTVWDNVISAVAKSKFAYVIKLWNLEYEALSLVSSPPGGGPEYCFKISCLSPVRCLAWFSYLYSCLAVIRGPGIIQQ